MPQPFQIPLSLEEGLGESMAVQLQTFLGVSMSLGSAFFGLVVLSKSKQCVISRRYLVQASLFGIGEQPTSSSCPPSGTPGNPLRYPPRVPQVYQYAPQALLNPELPLP